MKDLNGVHSLPLNEPFGLTDVDDAGNTISVAAAFDNTVELAIWDHFNGAGKFASLSPEGAIEFAAAVVKAAEACGPDRPLIPAHFLSDD